MNLKSFTMKVAVALIRFCYKFIGKAALKNQITIISRQSSTTTTDIALLSDYIRTNYPDIELKVLVRFIEPAISKKIGYAFHMLTQMKAIAESKVVVLDGYCIAASVLRHKPETKIVQMWHSMAAIKKYGYQTLDKKAGHSRQTARIMCMHKNYDYVLCPSIETGHLFCQGFNCSEDKLVELALPRIDFIKECMKPEKAAELRTELPQDREILLYAPTFRKGIGLDAKELLNSIDYDRFSLVIKPHPLYAEDLRDLINMLNLENKVLLDDTYETFEWLGACDRVITDYSAIAVESLVTGKPLYFYLYDFEEYKINVGINVDPTEEMPNATALTGFGLSEALNREYDFAELERFKNKYLTADTNDCTKKLGDFIYELTR